MARRSDSERSAQDELFLAPSSTPSSYSVEPPSSETELLERAWQLAGASLAALAERTGQATPDDLRRAKGWVGQLVEALLGATAKSLPEADFIGLGVELKTIPVDRRGLPRESTFVCSIPLRELGQMAWEDSRVRKKIRRVLWLPVEAEPEIPIGDRRVGSPLLWSPSRSEERRLEADWQTLAGLIADGYADAITAHIGEVMQVRPKAAHSGVRTRYVDEDGASDLTLPRGFYLRARFTAEILAQGYVRSAE